MLDYNTKWSHMCGACWASLEPNAVRLLETLDDADLHKANDCDTANDWPQAMGGFELWYLHEYKKTC